MVKLRPEQDRDQLFIESVYRSSRQAELDKTNWTEQQQKAFIIMQSMAQQADYRRKFPQGEYQIITFNKQDVGRLYTCETALEIRVIDITILPAFRGRKIGTYLLQQVIEKANSMQKKVTLHVLVGNPAIKLYLRLGFEIINNTGNHLLMERPANC